MGTLILLLLSLAASLSISGCSGAQSKVAEKKPSDETSKDGSDDTGGDGKGGDDVGEVVDPIPVADVQLSGKLVLGTTLALAESVSLSDLHLYCITFETSPASVRADFAQDGAFSITLKRTKPFGCFVVKTADGSTIATLLQERTASGGFGGHPKLSIALASSSDVGSLAIKNGRIEIPKSLLSDKLAEKPANQALFDLDAVHNQSYTVTCLDDPKNPKRKDLCQLDVTDDPLTPEIESSRTVFFRTLKGERAGEPKIALGVWTKKNSFDACGGIDLNDAAVKDLYESYGIEFSQVSAKPEFAYNDASCRGPVASLPKNYLAVEEMSTEVGHYILSDGRVIETTFEDGTKCVTELDRRFVFTGNDPDKIVGAVGLEFFTNCPDESNTAGTYNVVYSKVAQEANPQPPANPQTLASGCYRIGGGGYFSNGTGQSCALLGPNLISTCGTSDVNALTARNDHGGNQEQGACILPQTCYRIGGVGYYSNGQGQSCPFVGGQMQGICGTTDFNSLRELQTHGGNALDGQCP